MRLECDAPPRAPRHAVPSARPERGGFSLTPPPIPAVYRVLAVVRDERWMSSAFPAQNSSAFVCKRVVHTRSLDSQSNGRRSSNGLIERRESTTDATEETRSKQRAVAFFDLPLPRILRHHLLSPLYLFSRWHLSHRSRARPFHLFLSFSLSLARTYVYSRPRKLYLYPPAAAAARLSLSRA